MFFSTEPFSRPLFQSVNTSPYNDLSCILKPPPTKSCPNLDPADTQSQPFRTWFSRPFKPSCTGRHHRTNCDNIVSSGTGWAGFIYFRASHQCLLGLALPEPPFLFAVLVHALEAIWAVNLPLRLLLRLGQAAHYYPTSLLMDRDRAPVFAGPLGPPSLVLYLAALRVAPGSDPSLMALNYIPAWSRATGSADSGGPNAVGSSGEATIHPSICGWYNDNVGGDRITDLFRLSGLNVHLSSMPNQSPEACPLLTVVVNTIEIRLSFA
ncbi:unnamed protein product [Protopolystoma xenopodis]|uniref:Smad anchor for receptor activation-like C-terminal domain-containing protein n=1 Tax=Protopolystoma xenopodis TaxID=117903 RepID=A0A3S5A200_9PLAT|nr:unnamed protein product [Protopolystoma xenopodis]